MWQAASLLLAYPDEHQRDRLDTVDRLLECITGPAPVLLGRTVAALRAREPMRAAAEYVETFDLQRRSTMLLTYWTAGDTRNRGTQMLVFAQSYRDAGVQPPKDEAPDHLPVVLEFAATVDPVAGDACSPITASRSTCCGRPWSMPSRRTHRPSLLWLRHYRPPRNRMPIGYCTPGRRPKRLACSPFN